MWLHCWSALLRSNYISCRDVVPSGLGQYSWHAAMYLLKLQVRWRTLFWKSFTMKENKAEVEPSVRLVLSCLSGTLPLIAPWPRHLRRIPTSSACHRWEGSVRGGVGGVRPHSWYMMALNSTWLPGLWPSPRYPGAGCVRIAGELVRDAEPLVPLQTCLRKNFHFSQIVWWFMHGRVWETLS